MILPKSNNECFFHGYVQNDIYIDDNQHELSFFLSVQQPFDNYIKINVIAYGYLAKKIFPLIKPSDKVLVKCVFTLISKNNKSFVRFIASDILFTEKQSANLLFLNNSN